MLLPTVVWCAAPAKTRASIEAVDTLDEGSPLERVVKLQLDVGLVVTRTEKPLRAIFRNLGKPELYSRKTWKNGVVA